MTRRSSIGLLLVLIQLAVLVHTVFLLTWGIGERVIDLDYMSKTYNLTFCVWLYSLIIVCLMRLYEKLGGYFVRNTMRDYRLALFFHTIVAVLLFSAIIYVSIKWPLRHSLKSGTVLLLGLVIIFMMLTLLRTQKNQYIQYVQKVIELNRSNGILLTQGQARALFQLRGYHYCFRARSDNGRRLCKEKHGVLFRLKVLDDFYRLSRWLCDLQAAKDKKEFEHVVHKLENEIRDHLRLYDLDETERKNLSALAEYEGLILPFCTKKRAVRGREVPLLFEDAAEKV